MKIKGIIAGLLAVCGLCSIGAVVANFRHTVWYTTSLTTATTP